MEHIERTQAPTWTDLVSGAMLGATEIMIETDYNPLNKREIHESIVVERKEGGKERESSLVEWQMGNWEENFIEEKPERHHFNQVIKVNTPSNGTKWHPSPPDRMLWEKQASLLCYSCQRCITCVSHKEASGQFRLRDTLWSKWPIIFQGAKVMKVKGSVKNCSRQKRHDNQMQLLIPNWVFFLHRILLESLSVVWGLYSNNITKLTSQFW